MSQTALLKNSADVRQVGIVTLYMACLAAMYTIPECRNLFFFLAACYLSFLNNIVIHNHMHTAIFHSKRWNTLFRWVLSFGSLYPVTANIPAHNLVHHHFNDDGLPDWAAPQSTRFKWHLLNLIHFPNVIGPQTFAGVTRWMRNPSRAAFKRQFQMEQLVAFGFTIALCIHDFWTTLFFIVIPQLYGARCILRINLIQHDDCDIESEWNHSRNFVGRGFNYVMCNNGYHTIHHNRAGIHWSHLAEAHRKECKPKIDADLDEKSMVFYLIRTFLLSPWKKHTDRSASRARAGVVVQPSSETIHA
jgi:fatty acid desaturase